MTSYIGDKQVLKTTTWRRCTVMPSNNRGYVNVMFLDGPQAGRTLSIDPTGNEVEGSHDPDGMWEQARLFGTRIVYDYEGMTCPPVVYDIMVA